MKAERSGDIWSERENWKHEELKTESAFMEWKPRKGHKVIKEKFRLSKASYRIYDWHLW